MANSFFRFKEFTIHQDRCSLKVSTDACILGAWLANRVPKGASILDIGSGSGLLMQMLAQKVSGKMLGIEIDEPSCIQSLENLEGGPWKDRQKVILGDVRSYPFKDKFDFVLSNPPFFEKDLPSTELRKTMAKHSTHLTLMELIQRIEKVLAPMGSWGVLLPYSRSEEWISLCSQIPFFPTHHLRIRNSREKAFFRSVIIGGRAASSALEFSDLSIYDETGQYTLDFRALLKDYYLHF